MEVCDSISSVFDVTTDTSFIITFYQLNYPVSAPPEMSTFLQMTKNYLKNSNVSDTLGIHSDLNASWPRK